MDLIKEEREDHLFQEDSCNTWVLMGVEDLSKKFSKDFDDQSSFSLEESLAEMKELCTTAGLLVKAVVTQRLQGVVPKSYMGTGKLEEAKGVLHDHGACTLVVDAEPTITPSILHWRQCRQQRTVCSRL